MNDSDALAQALSDAALAAMEAEQELLPAFRSAVAQQAQRNGTSPLYEALAAAADHGIDAPKAILCDQNDLGQSLRAVAPFYAVLTTRQRRRILFAIAAARRP